MLVLTIVMALAADETVSTEHLSELLAHQSSLGSTHVLAAGHVGELRAISLVAQAPFTVSRAPRSANDSRLAALHTKSDAQCSFFVQSVDEQRWRVRPVGTCAPIAPAYDAGVWVEDRPARPVSDTPVALHEPAIHDPDRVLYGVSEANLDAAVDSAARRAGLSLADGQSGVFADVSGPSSRFTIAGEVQSIDHTTNWPDEHELAITWSVLDNRHQSVVLSQSTYGYAVDVGDVGSAELAVELTRRSLWTFATDTPLTSLLAQPENSEFTTVNASAPLSRLGEAVQVTDPALRQRIRRTVGGPRTAGTLEVVGGLVLAAGGGLLIANSVSEAQRAQNISTGKWWQTNAKNTLGWGLALASPVFVWDGAKRINRPRRAR